MRDRPQYYRRRKFERSRDAGLQRLGKSVEIEAGKQERARCVRSSYQGEGARARTRRLPHSNRPLSRSEPSFQDLVCSRA